LEKGINFTYNFGKLELLFSPEMKRDFAKKRFIHKNGLCRIAER